MMIYISKLNFRWLDNDRNGRKWSMLLKIQWTSINFTKIDMKQHKNACSSSCLQFLWNKSRNSCINCLSKRQEFSWIQNPDPRTKKVGRKPDPPGQWERANPRGWPGGDGQAWNWLIRYARLKKYTIFWLTRYLTNQKNTAVWQYPQQNKDFWNWNTKDTPLIHLCKFSKSAP